MSESSLDAALECAANDSKWLGMPVQLWRHIKVLAEEVKRLTAENAEYVSGLQTDEVAKGLARCERESAVLKEELLKLRAQLEQVHDVLKVQDAQFENERYVLKGEIARWRQKAIELEEKRAGEEAELST